MSSIRAEILGPIEMDVRVIFVMFYFDLLLRKKIKGTIICLLILALGMCLCQISTVTAESAAVCSWLGHEILPFRQDQFGYNTFHGLFRYGVLNIFWKA